MFRGLYHYGQAEARGEATDPVVYLAREASSLGLIKAERQRSRQADEERRQIWGNLLS